MVLIVGILVVLSLTIDGEEWEDGEYYDSDDSGTSGHRQVVHLVQADPLGPPASPLDPDYDYNYNY